MACAQPRTRAAAWSGSSGTATLSIVVGQER
jgi:hypothetical protein